MTVAHVVHRLLNLPLGYLECCTAILRQVCQHSHSCDVASCSALHKGPAPLTASLQQVQYKTIAYIQHVIPTCNVQHAKFSTIGEPWDSAQLLLDGLHNLFVLPQNRGGRQFLPEDGEG